MFFFPLKQKGVFWSKYILLNPLNQATHFHLFLMFGKIVSVYCSFVHVFGCFFVQLCKFIILFAGMQVLEWNGVILTGKTYEEVQGLVGQLCNEAEVCVRL